MSTYLCVILGDSGKLGQVKLEEIDTDPYDLLINAYWRSGSTYTGRIMGHHNDTFYFYEPLQKQLQWEFYISNSTYSIRRNQSRDLFTIDRSLEILNMIYSCNFTGFGPILNAGIYCTQQEGGPMWLNLTVCTKQFQMKRTQNWLPELTNKCNTSRYIVAKVLRINPTHAELLVRKHPRLKILHLFRDPRALMFSLYNYKSSPFRRTPNMSEVHRVAKLMCKKMMYDFTSGVTTKSRLPNRFKFLRYEDLIDNGDVVKNMLYTFINMQHFTRRTKDMSNEQNVSKKHAHGSNWRLQIPWKFLEVVDRACNDVYTILGYIRYTNIKELRNITLPVTKFPYEL